jgi:hypothetical protein
VRENRKHGSRRGKSTIHHGEALLYSTPRIWKLACGRFSNSYGLVVSPSRPERREVLLNQRSTKFSDYFLGL